MTRQTAATIAMSTAITEHLQSNPEQTTAEITSALKADPGTIGSAMQRLFKAGRVKKIQWYEQVKSEFHSSAKWAVRNRWSLVEVGV